jgi:hypothetical protein
MKKNLSVITIYIYETEKDNKDKDPYIRDRSIYTKEFDIEVDYHTPYPYIVNKYDNNTVIDHLSYILALETAKSLGYTHINDYLNEELLSIDKEQQSFREEIKKALGGE